MGAQSDIAIIGVDRSPRKWGSFLALGIVLVVLGVIAILFAELATMASVLVFGWILLVAGIAEVIHSFNNRGWGGFLLNLLIAVLNIVLGLLFLTQPGAGALALTLLLAALFFVGGIFRIITSAEMRFSNWGCTLLSGIIAVLLGIGLWTQWPISGVWFIGLAVGIEMLFRGVSWIAFAIGLKLETVSA